MSSFRGLEASCHDVLPQVASPKCPTATTAPINYLPVDPLLEFFNKVPDSCVDSNDNHIECESDSEEVVYICPCDRSFKHKTSFDRHMDLNHSDSAQSFKCNLCGKTFGNLSVLTMHMSVHGHNKKSSLASLAAQDSDIVKKSPARIKKSKASSTVAKSKPKENAVTMDMAMEIGYAKTDRQLAEEGYVTEQGFGAPCDNIPPATSTVEVSTEPINTKEESDKENELTDWLAQEQGPLNPENLSQQIEYAVLKIQQRGGVFTSGVETTGAQVVTIPLVKQSTTVASSSSGQMAQVYKYPATAAPVQLPQSVSMHESEMSVTEDDTKVRKSARLTGKVPLWRTDLQEEPQLPQPRQLRLRERPSEEGGSDMEDIMPNITRMLGEEGEALKAIAKQDRDEAAKRQRISKEEFKCEQCGKVYNSEKYLSMHMAIHNKNQTEETALAPEMKPEQNGYIKNGNSWTCKICSKTFAQNSSFKNHMRTHSDERPYVCEICSIGFKERYHLKKHLLFIHTTELKEQCRFCNKRFKDSTAVRAHERIHSNERPYQCRNCKKAFKTSECLWHHENRSKACGKLAKLLPPAKRSRRTRKNRKGEANGEEEEVKPVVKFEQQSMVYVPASAEQLLSKMPVQVKTTLPAQIPQVMARPVHKEVIKSEPLDFTEMESEENMKLVDQVVDEVIEKDDNFFREDMLDMDSNMNISDEMDTGKGDGMSVDLPIVTTLYENSVPDAAHSIVVTASGMIEMAPAVNQVYSVSVTQQLEQPLQPTSNVMVPQQIPEALPTSMATIAPRSLSANIIKHEFSQQNTVSMAQIPTMQTRPTIQPIEPTPGQHMYTKVLVSPRVHNQHNQAQQVPQSSVPDSTSSTVQQGVNVSPTNTIPMTSQQVSTVGSIIGTTVGITAGSTVGSSVSQPLTFVQAPVNVKTIHSTMSQPVHLPTPSPIPSTVARPVAAVSPWVSVPKKFIKQETIEDAAQQPTPIMPADSHMDLKPQMKHLAHARMSNFVCQYCNKGYAALEAFQKHLQRHEADMPYRCEECQMPFKLKVHLKKHNLYRHDNNKYVKCRLCPKTFKDSSAVRLHERIHSDERPFECNCGKRFKTRENLWGHQRRKSKKSNFGTCGSSPDDRIHAVFAPNATSPNGDREVMSHVYVQQQANEDSHGYMSSDQSNGFSGALFPSSTASSSSSALPPIASFTSMRRKFAPPKLSIETAPASTNCPTIENLLKTGPTPPSKLPGIQRMFQPGSKDKLMRQASSDSTSSQVKPPPPYPGHMASGPMLSEYESTFSEQQTPPPGVSYAGSGEMASPYSSSGRSSSGPRTPGTPESLTSSATSSQGDHLIFDNSVDNSAPVLTQWVENSGNLFHELSSNVFNSL